MNERRVQEAIAVLEQEVPRENTRVRIAQYGGGPEESQIIANQAGFLRLGVEFLKAAYAPGDCANAPASVEVDLDYLLTADSYQFAWFERREPTEEPDSPVGWLVAAVFFSALAAGIVLAVIGLFVVVRWLAA